MIIPKNDFIGKTIFREGTSETENSPALGMIISKK